ncbi:hypothetical protein CMK11_10270 [Candidatus Poribacteria bacterium]|nr:hypothetical protein [Candidatus Poribacteria bacterium]
MPGNTGTSDLNLFVCRANGDRAMVGPSLQREPIRSGIAMAPATDRPGRPAAEAFEASPAI